MELITMNNGPRNSFESVGRSRSLSKAPARFLSIICILEAIILGMFISYMLYYSEKDLEQTPNQHKLISSYKNVSSKSSIVRSTYRVYTSDISEPMLSLKQNHLRVGVSGCTQRIHDFRHSIKCRSLFAEECSDLGSLPLQRSAGKFVVVTTSKAGRRLEVEQLPINLTPRCADLPRGCKFSTILEVDSSHLEQEIIGWGGALTDSSINNILSLTTNGTKQLLRDYFGSDGLRFNMVRITIGGSDFSSRFYTNDDTSDNLEDFDMDEFKLTEEDVLYKIPMLNYLQEELNADSRELKVFASMWSPPTWMKSNHHFNQGQLKTVEGDKYYIALAQLKKNFLTAYLDNSIKMWGLTVMNEPIFARQPFLNFNTMIFPPEDYAKYVSEYLGPMIRQDERTKDIKLMIHDDNRKYIMYFTDPILNRPEVRKYVDGISTHGYTDEDYHLMDEIVKKHVTVQNNSELFVLPSELCSGHLPWMEKASVGNWHRGVHYALDIIHSLQHRGAGWVDWNMALDTSGGPGWLGGRLDSPVIVDKEKDLYHKSPMFYVLGQFSRYILPGSIKVHTTITNNAYDGHFETVTFRLANEGDLVTVVLNNNPYEIVVHLALVDREGYQAVRCSPDSITTVIYGS